MEHFYLHSSIFPFQFTAFRFLRYSILPVSFHSVSTHIHKLMIVTASHGATYSPFPTPKMQLQEEFRIPVFFNGCLSFQQQGWGLDQLAELPFEILTSTEKAIPHPLTMFYWKHVRHGCAVFRTAQGSNPSSVKRNLSSTVLQHNASPLPLLLWGRFHFAPCIHYCSFGVMYGDTSLNGCTLIGLWSECLCYDWLPLKASRPPPPSSGF